MLAQNVDSPVGLGAAGARSVLACSGLHKIYRMGEVDVHALDGVDFTLHAGELLVLLGASGSGKSTLLNILGGLDVPSSGQVFFEAQELVGACHPEGASCFIIRTDARLCTCSGWD
jgi:ABC-type oligopeptide transport system ATPase subunit